MTTVENLKGQWFINDIHFRSVTGEWQNNTINAGQGNLTDAWIATGVTSTNNPTSRTERIIFSNDTTTSQVRANITTTQTFTAGVGNVTDAWYMGGELNTQISRIIFSSDTSNATTRGNTPSSLTGNEWAPTQTGNSTDGWYFLSRIARLTFSNDTVSMPIRATMNTPLINMASTGNSTDGWFGSGAGGAFSNFTTIIQRIIFVNDTITSTRRGNLNQSRSELAATGNSTDGWFAGGLISGITTMTSRVDRITFAQDTNTAQTRGPLPYTTDDYDASGNTTDGWFIAGGAPEISSIVRITFASDTGTAQRRGQLSSNRYGHSASQ